MTLFVALLFFVLTPGVLIVLPPNMIGTPNALYIVAATHALVFAVIYYLTKRIIWRNLYPGKYCPYRSNCPYRLNCPHHRHNFGDQY